MMEIRVNGEIFQVEDNVSIARLLHILKIDFQKGIAIALNESVLSKSSWERTVCQSGDQIIIIKATAGG